MPRVIGSDIYTNFFTITTTLDAADSSIFTEERVNTPMGTVMNVAWEINRIEVFPLWSSNASGLLTMTLSTQGGLAAEPGMNTKGIIGQWRFYFDIQGAAYLNRAALPFYTPFLPPVLIASPHLSLYCQYSINDVQQRGAEHSVRLHYTAESLDAAKYRELFETWNFAN